MRRATWFLTLATVTACSACGDDSRSTEGAPGDQQRWKDGGASSADAARAVPVGVTLRPCDPHPCRDGGSCPDGGTDFSCACQTGFAGQTCEIPAAIGCDTKPCFHGGTCVDGPAGYRCLCPAAYKGPQCEFNGVD